MKIRVSETTQTDLTHELEITQSDNQLNVHSSAGQTQGTCIALPGMGTYSGKLIFKNGQRVLESYATKNRGRWMIAWQGQLFEFEPSLTCLPSKLGHEILDQQVRSFMPGKIVTIMVKIGEMVEPGQPLLVIEAMKMENEIRSPMSGKVQSIAVHPGQLIEAHAPLIHLVKS